MKWLGLVLATLILGFAHETQAQGFAIRPHPVIVPLTQSAPQVPRQVRARLRRELAARRRVNTRRFNAYARRGVFPDNHLRPGQVNIFIDDEGKICAAANLMAEDGLLPLVQATAQRDNTLRLRSVQSGPLYEWILSSGFTQEEVDRIQEPYFHIDDELSRRMQRSLQEDEKRRLQRHFREVKRELQSKRDVSLNAAVERLIAYRIQRGIAVDAPVLARPITPARIPEPSVVVAPPPAGPVVVMPAAGPVVQPVRFATRQLAMVRDPLVWEPGMNR